MATTTTDEAMAQARERAKLDGSTVAFEVGGKRTDPVALSELYDRADEAAARLRGEQLSFDIGARGDRPDFASVKVSGDLAISRDLRRRQEFTVTVATDDGEVVAAARAKVTGIGFKDKTDKYGTTTERVHTLTLE